jgi:tungstate transport system substrate-binding protein
MLVSLFLCASAHAQQTYITLASTTSTEQSGLFKHLLPIFEKKTGIQVRVVALGTGQALDMGRRGDADVVFVHARPLEEKFLAEGFGTQRHDVMYNDFVLIGPKADPAKVAGSKDAADAFRRIRSAQAPFVSRGDKSGTHFAELGIWKAAGIDIAKGQGDVVPRYRPGDGAGAEHCSGNERLHPRRSRHVAFVQEPRRADNRARRATRLFNQYGIILVNPAKHPSIKKAEGQAFIDWILSPAGQKAIADYRIGGEQLFFPNAKSR